jgi:hypothetical protein
VIKDRDANGHVSEYCKKRSSNSQQKNRFASPYLLPCWSSTVSTLKRAKALWPTRRPAEREPRPRYSTATAAASIGPRAVPLSGPVQASLSGTRQARENISSAGSQRQLRKQRCANRTHVQGQPSPARGEVAVYGGDGRRSCSSLHTWDQLRSLWACGPLPWVQRAGLALASRIKKPVCLGEERAQRPTSISSRPCPLLFLASVASQEGN